MSDTPTVEEELERKATDTLSQALKKLSAGQSTVETTEATLRALWDTVSGLVSKELMEMIADGIDATASIYRTPRKRIFIDGPMTAIITLPETSDCKPEILMLGNGGYKRKRVSMDDLTLSELVDKTHKVATNLCRMGYEEIK